MIKVRKDDYIIVNYTGKKPSLALVIDPNHHKADLEVSKDENSQVDTMITYDPENVVANLGPDPKVGKVFGIDIEPYRNTLTSKKFGQIHIYRKMDEKDFKALKRAMKSLYPKLKANRCNITLPLTFRVKPPKGKYSGYFKMITRKKDNQVMDYIALTPKVMTDPQYLEYVLAHEIMHSLWFRAVPDHIKAKWLKLYLKRVLLVKIKRNTLEALGKELVAYNGTINDYMKEMADEETNAVIKEVLTWIAKKQRIDRRSMKLLQEYDSDRLLELWPSHAEITKGMNDPTEYAMKNVEEFFAECGALHITGKKCRKDIQKALKYTFKKMMYVVDIAGMYDDDD